MYIYMLVVMPFLILNPTGLLASFNAREKFPSGYIIYCAVLRLSSLDTLKFMKLRQVDVCN